MSDDIDFDQLIDLLDRALVSDDPKVKKALKKFLFITALATEDTEESGPLRDLISRIEALEAKVNSGGWGGYQWPPTTNTPMWYTSNGTGVIVGSTGNTTASTTTTFADTTSTYTSSSIDTLIDDSMRDLEDLQKQASNLQK